MIVLWDIDGTLVDTHGHGRRAFALALERTWGVVDDLKDINFAGATDLWVLAQLRKRLALSDAHDARFFELLASSLDEVLQATPARALPYAAETVRGLQERGVVQGLVTGNAAKCARAKLSSAGVNVDAFRVGAYGDEHAERTELASRALARAQALASSIDDREGRESSERVVLVGDTPNDVKAAKHIGAVAVAVVNGRGTRASLVDAGADHVVDDLSDFIALYAARFIDARMLGHGHE